MINCSIITIYGVTVWTPECSIQFMQTYLRSHTHNGQDKWGLILNYSFVIVQNMSLKFIFAFQVRCIKCNVNEWGNRADYYTDLHKIFLVYYETLLKELRKDMRVEIYAGTGKYLVWWLKIPSATLSRFSFVLKIWKSVFYFHRAGASWICCLLHSSVLHYFSIVHTVICLDTLCCCFSCTLMHW